MKILAVDPGERVGWATGELDGDNLTIGAHGITALWPFALKLSQRVDTYDVVIYETWRLRRDMASKFIGNDFQTVQLIGVIRFLAMRTNTVQLVSQGPAIKSTAEKTAPPSLRARLDSLPKAHDECHDYDALLHLHYWHWKRYKDGEIYVD